MQVRSEAGKRRVSPHARFASCIDPLPLRSLAVRHKTTLDKVLNSATSRSSMKWLAKLLISLTYAMGPYAYVQRRFWTSRSTELREAA
jgi:hypothetical protein